MLITRQERSQPTEINASVGLRAVTFKANGQYLLPGGRYEHIAEWRVKDGEHVHHGNHKSPAQNMNFSQGDISWDVLVSPWQKM